MEAKTKLNCLLPGKEGKRGNTEEEQRFKNLKTVPHPKGFSCLFKLISVATE